MNAARANPSTAQTNTNLIPPLNNRAIKVTKIYISSDTAMTVTLLNSETHSVLWRQYVGARGGVALPVLFLSALHEGIDYSTSDAGNVFILVEYGVFGSVA